MILKVIDDELPYGGVGASTVTSVPFPTESPAVRARVYIPLTSILVLMYSIMFILTFIQLLQIRYYQHKRFSYQTSLLFLILFWSSLRIFLFSFYFQNVEQANMFDFSVYFCLYCLPAVLQFGTFCVLVLYYGQVFNKVVFRQDRKYYNTILRVVVAVGVLLFVVTSFVVAYLTRMCRYKSDTELLTQLSLIRVYTNDSLFVLFGVLLSFYLFKLVKITKKQYLPEKSRVSVSKALVITIFTTFFLITRGIYNVLALNAARLNLPDFNFGWINVSDQADLVSLTDTNKFVSFFCVLAIWELIPTFVIICIFRLAKTDRVSTVMNLAATTTESFAGKSVFLESRVSAEFATDSIEYYSKHDQQTTPILSESFTSDNGNINEIRYYQSMDNT